MKKKCPKCEKKFIKEKKFLEHWYTAHAKKEWKSP